MHQLPAQVAARELSGQRSVEIKRAGKRLEVRDVAAAKAGEHLLRQRALRLWRVVDHRGAWTVMAHPGHEISQAAACRRCEGISGMPQVVKVQIRYTNRGDILLPIRQVTARQLNLR